MTVKELLQSHSSKKEITLYVSFCDLDNYILKQVKVVTKDWYELSDYLLNESVMQFNIGENYINAWIIIPEY